MLKVVLVGSVKTSERVLPTAVLLSSCTATRSWSTEPGKRLARQYSVGSPELGAADRRAYSGAAGFSRQDGQMLMEQPGPRARDHVACRWVHRPAFFFGLQAKAPRGPPAACWSLEGSAEARGLGVGKQDAALPTAEARRSSRCALPAENGRRPTRGAESLAPCTARARRAADVLTMVKIPEPDAD